MTDHELLRSSALEQARLVRERQVSPSELVELYLDRIERIDPDLNSFITVAHEQARAAATAATHALDAGDPQELPAFHGVPIAVKDLHATAGIRTTYGLVTFKDHVPTEDEHTVSRLKAAGFLVLGKTNTPESGVGCVTEPPTYGPCRNPWDRALTPGGSSGGAAAALAAGLTPVAHGSDGGGSIRIPSAWCGLVGVKPSRGRILRPPSAAGGGSTVGPLAWTVADAAAVTTALAGPAVGPELFGLPSEAPYLAEVAKHPGRLRIGVDDDGVALDPACRDTLERTAALLEELGHEVEQVSLGEDWSGFFHRRMLEDPAARQVHAVADTASTRGEPPLEYRYPVNLALLDGPPMDAVDFVLAQARIEKDVRTWVARALSTFDEFDVVLTPTTATAPIPVGLHESMDALDLLAHWYRAVPYTTLFNNTGQPAVNLPLGVDEDGLPIGMQFVGRPADEATLFRLAGQLEQASPWAQRRPPDYWDET